MKLKMMLLMLMVSPVAFAQVSGSHGGDECERKFKEISYDLDSWIQRGGPKTLQFLPDENPQTYGQKMTVAIEDLLFKNKTVVECSSKSVYVDGVEKTCAWSFSNEDQKNHITCNYQRFLRGVDNQGMQEKRDEDAMYRLVHHELAGIAGLEPNVGNQSIYFYSDQIVASLEDQVVRKLAIKTMIRPSERTCEYDNYSDGSKIFKFCRDSFAGKIIRNPTVQGMPVMKRSNSAAPDLICRAFKYKKAISTETTRTQVQGDTDALDYFIWYRDRTIIWEGQGEKARMKFRKNNLSNSKITLQDIYVQTIFAGYSYNRLTSVTCE